MLVCFPANVCVVLRGISSHNAPEMAIRLRQYEDQLTDEEITAGAKAIAADMMLPGGSAAKLAKVINRHLQWFEAARQRGMTWDDIIALLFEAGARRQGGLPLSRGHLSSLVWRKSKAVADKIIDTTSQHATKEDASSPAFDGGNYGNLNSEEALSTSPKRTHPKKLDRKRSPSGPVGKVDEAVRAPQRQTETQPTPRRRASDSSGSTGDDKAALRELLQRAAAARSQKNS